MFPRICFLGLFWLMMPLQGWSQTSTFTYQGRLKSGDTPATGSYDFSFALFDAPTDGTPQGPQVNRPGVAVSNGLFSVVLDFGAVPLNGSERWLEIGVMQAGQAGPPTVLQPRQRLTAAPYAVRAAAASSYAGPVNDSQLSTNVAMRNADQAFSGSVQFASAQGTFTGAFIGNGAGLTNIPGAVPARTAMTGLMTGLPTSSATAFYSAVSGISPVEVSEPLVSMLSPNTGMSAGNLRVQLASPPGSGKGFTFTLRVNGSDTTITTTIQGDQTTGNSGPTRADVPAGAQLSFKIQAIGTPSIDRASFGWTLE